MPAKGKVNDPASLVFKKLYSHTELATGFNEPVKSERTINEN